MLAPSDNWFGEVKGDGGAPEIAVGRLPARDEEELNRMIDKIITRESSQGSPWLKRLLLLADNPDKAGDFHEDSEGLAALAFPHVSADRIYLPVSPFSDARTRLFEGIHEGRGQVSYVGHAGYDVLADEGLLKSGDVAGLTNADRPFVLTAMTCTAGNFALPWYPSISELLVHKSSGGAAAVWSPTAQSQDSLAAILAGNYYDRALGTEDVRIGDAVLSALKGYEKAGNPSYITAIYVLLGDPAMWLH
jgi:hypothetical protein